jgi:triosephosphate isomerase (TIM)
MRVKLVAGNWKMNGNLASGQALVKAVLPLLATLDRARYAICAPFPYLMAMNQALRGSSVALGAQDLCQFDDGAYTGEVSGAMLADCGCRYVIVGHSERRGLFGDTDENVARKYAQALKQGLIPILCVGEVLAEREAGVTEPVVARQLDAVVDHCGVAAFERGVVAYEPVWAIGTGLTPTLADIAEIHAAIRGPMPAGARILYGGSVNPKNAAEILALEDVDGALVGGASLKADDFWAIAQACG